MGVARGGCEPTWTARHRSTNGGDPQAELDVVVLDGSERQSLVCVRSLGAAGLRVGAFGSQRWSPALYSRWCLTRGILPDPAADAAGLADAVLGILDRHRPAALIAATDGTIEALRRRRREVDEWTTLSLASEEALRVAVDKTETLGLAAELAVPTPRTVRVDELDDVDVAVLEVGLPAVVKPVRSWVEKGARGQRLTSSVVVDAAEARLAAAQAVEAGGSVVLQEWVTGSREAISLFHADGRVWARFAQVAYRMFPPLGGSSVVRESIPLPPDLLEAAERLVAAAGLEGYAEVEFRRDAKGRGLLMEINPRLSASVEIAVRAGIDFPTLVYNHAAGSPLGSADSYRTGLRMRWLGGDIRWLRATLRLQGRPEAVAAPRAVASFGREFLRRSAYDYCSLSDLRPAAAATIGFASTALAKRRAARGARRRR
jgi:predicted ATP-grasp superfamily ATP-dependent carboligase